MKNFSKILCSAAVLCAAMLAFDHGETVARADWQWNAKNKAYYYYDKGRILKNRWIGDYYVKADGKMARNEWIWDAGYKAYYYLTDSGKYARNMWQKDFYLKANGKMARNEWIWDSNHKSYYYLKDSGAYARNTWQKEFYLKANGKMAKNEWVWDSNYKAYYYLKGTGRYAFSQWNGDFYLKADGKMAASQWVFDPQYQEYFYFNSGGKYSAGRWQGNYYLKPTGAMARNELLNLSYNGRHQQVYFDSSGYARSVSDMHGLNVEQLLAVLQRAYELRIDKFQVAIPYTFNSLADLRNFISNTNKTGVQDRGLTLGDKDGGVKRINVGANYMIYQDGHIDRVVLKVDLTYFLPTTHNGLYNKYKAYLRNWVTKNIYDKHVTSDIAKVKLIRNHIVNNYSYDYDLRNEADWQVSVHSPVAFYNNKQGVCQAYSLYFRDMARMAGLSVRYVPGDSVNPKGQSEAHAWNTVKVGGRWYGIDTTWNDILGGYNYYLWGANSMNRDHRPMFPYESLSSTDYPW
ncbi:MAG: transglutaminase domain-containing protein [Lachnospiraceae bacterium]|nr:transglutaminase domain-containing protein [Lachnospiraceae bacterium]MDY5742184.1 transglutaminase domain-containing protein [Lachnospiraceae bacterium]